MIVPPKETSFNVIGYVFIYYNKLKISSEMLPFMFIFVQYKDLCLFSFSSDCVNR